MAKIILLHVPELFNWCAGSVSFHPHMYNYYDNFNSYFAKFTFPYF